MKFFKMLKKFRALLNVTDKIDRLNARIDLNDYRILIANVQANINLQKPHVSSLRQVEFKVFSQWGDDGIIQWLIQKLNLTDETFIEIGVENYVEANTRFLLMNNNWSGLVVDGSSSNVAYIQQDEIYWKYDLTAIASFVTAENVNITINNYLKEKEILNVGLLSIDIDGMDYWVWKTIDVIQPVIVIVEYNSVFGKHTQWTVPYNAGFHRTSAHYSNLYYGASLGALCSLAEEKGYDFVGCNSAGNNAYFILKERNSLGISLTADEGYIVSKFRESRNEDGSFSFVSGHDRIKIISGLPIYDLSIGEIITI